MNTKELKELEVISSQIETFLIEYSKGIYGKVAKRIDVTEQVVKKFMEKSSKSDMQMVMSYLEFKDEMIADKGGAEDLEDWIDYVIYKQNDNF